MSVAPVQVGLFERPPMIRDRAIAAVPPAPAMKPRPYQDEAIRAVLKAWETKRSTLAVLATGLGKTVIASELARQRGCVLFIAHRETLIEQAADKLRKVTGQLVAVEKAERRASARARFIVASVQSLRGDRLRFFADVHRQHIDTIIIDECHRAVAKGYRDVLDAFPEARVLGLTATADRGDKKAMGLVFEKTDTEHGGAFKYDIVDGTRDGWLTIGDWYPLNVDGVSLDEVGLKGNDIDQGALDEQLVLQVARIARAMHDAAGGEMSLGFCPGVKTAEAAAEVLNRLEPGCARATWGEQEGHVRKAIEDAWVRGEFPYLLNCALYIEGADFPRLKNVFMFAATKSRLRWAQIYGRGTRLWPTGIDHLPTAEERLAAIAASPKPRWRFFDAQYGKHGHTLAGPVDLLGGRYDDETKARAKKKLAEQGGSVEGALELAAAELAEENRRKLARLAAKAARAQGKVKVGKARGAHELFGAASEHDGDGPSFDVFAWLRAQGVGRYELRGMSPEKAKKWRARLLERKRLGLGTYKQFMRLKALGVPGAESLSAGRCGFMLNRLGMFKNGRKEYRHFNPHMDAWALGGGEVR